MQIRSFTASKQLNIYNIEIGMKGSKSEWRANLRTWRVSIPGLLLGYFRLKNKENVRYAVLWYNLTKLQFLVLLSMEANCLKKIFSGLLVCVLLSMFLGGCTQDKRYQVSEVGMDTVVQLTIYDKNAEQAAAKAIEQMRRLDVLLNGYSPQSEISKINDNAGQAVQVSSDTIAVVSRALDYAQLTDGAFDPTIGSVSKLWSVGKKGEFVPTAEQIKAAVALVDYKQVKVDKDAQTVKLNKSGMILDLGGVAKGYILETMLKTLKDSGVKSALVNGGGDVLTLGKRADGKPWRIGVQDPRKPDGILQALDMNKYDQASTSGDYQRYFIKDGVRYHHVFDTRSGYPTRGLISATIIGRQSDVDIPSNVLMVMGEMKALEFMSAYPSIKFILVNEQGVVRE